MTSSEKKGIFTVIGVMTAIMLIVLCVKLFGEPKDAKNKQNTQSDTVASTYVETLSDGTKINTSSDFLTSKTYKTVKISGIQFTSKNGNSNFLADVENTGTTTFERENISIVLLDEKGKEITKISGSIPELKAGKKGQIDLNISMDVVNASDFKIEAR